MARPGRYGELLLLDTTVYEGPVVPFGRPSDVVDLQGKNFKAIVKTLERVRKNTDLLDNILANLIPKGETQREIGGPLIFPYATTPANWASGQVYWNSASDVMFYNHLGTAKRVGTPVPWWNFASTSFTDTSWAFISNLNQTITPVQKGTVVMLAHGLWAGPGGADTIALRLWISPSPADFQSSGSISKSGAGSSSFVPLSAAATLTAGTTYQIGLQGTVSAGSGNATAWIQNVYSFAA